MREGVVSTMRQPLTKIVSNMVDNNPIGGPVNVSLADDSILAPSRTTGKAQLSSLLFGVKSY